MKRLTYFLLVMFCFYFRATAQLDTTIVEKTGWLVYNIGHVIWFEAALKKDCNDNVFFETPNYPNGLIIDGMYSAKYYQSIARCYSILNLSDYDTLTKEAKYTIPDTICIIPVKAKYRVYNRSAPSLLNRTGLSFKRGDNEVTVTYNFEADYYLLDVELLRKKDKRRLKRVKNYVVFPPH